MKQAKSLSEGTYSVIDKSVINQCDQKNTVFLPVLTPGIRQIHMQHIILHLLFSVSPVYWSLSNIRAEVISYWSQSVLIIDHW